MFSILTEQKRLLECRRGNFEHTNLNLTLEDGQLMVKRSPFIRPNFEQLNGCLIYVQQSLLLLAFIVKGLQLADDYVHSLRILCTCLEPLRALQILEEEQDK